MQREKKKCVSFTCKDTVSRGKNWISMKNIFRSFYHTKPKYYLQTPVTAKTQELLAKVLDMEKKSCKQNRHKIFDTDEECLYLSLSKTIANW
jgi:hypothetical protein